MPRIALALLTVFVLPGCFFDASYSGTLRCSDDRCPSGLVCHMGTCVTSIPIDMMVDVPDALPPALTCADPGIFQTDGGTATGTTTGTTSKMSSVCPTGIVNNGPDRVYRISMNGADQLRVAITGDRKAYVIASCVPAPSTPPCLGNTRATMGNPIVVQPAAGFAYVVVDDENAAATGDYTLTLSIP